MTPNDPYNYPFYYKNNRGPFPIDTVVDVADDVIVKHNIKAGSFFTLDLILHEKGVQKS